MAGDDTEDLGDLEIQEDGPDRFWDKQWQISHLLSCWARIEREVAPHHAEAFRLCVIKEMPAKNVAKKLGISLNHVYQIKVRMTQRLREAMAELMELE